MRAEKGTFYSDATRAETKKGTFYSGTGLQLRGHLVADNQ